MNKASKRIPIYIALAALCALTSAAVGTAAGLWSFVQVVAVIELIYWIAGPAGKPPAEGW